MKFGRILPIIVDRRVFRQPSSLDFAGLRLRLSFGWSWSTCFVSFFHLLCLIFALALVSFSHSLWPCFLTRLVMDPLGVSTCFMLRLASCFDLHCVDLSTSLRALAVNSLGGLIIFRMLGAYVDSTLGTHIPALWVLLDFSVIKCTLVLHTGTSGRVIPLFKRHCSADDLSPLIGVVAWFRTRRLP